MVLYYDQGFTVKWTQQYFARSTTTGSHSILGSQIITVCLQSFLRLRQHQLVGLSMNYAVTHKFINFAYGADFCPLVNIYQVRKLF